jgi:ribosome biogenesis GTPase
LEQLKRVLKEKVSAFAGPSGVGKSSLLNALQPGLRLRTGPLTALGHGRHVTSEVRLLPLDFGGFVADTPGIQVLHLIEVRPEQLPRYFPEIQEYGAACRFPNCSHLREPDCAVQQAVQRGSMDPLRYESYRQMRLELEEQASF